MAKINLQNSAKNLDKNAANELSRISQKGEFACTKYVGIKRYKCVAARSKFLEIILKPDKVFYKSGELKDISIKLLQGQGGIKWTITDLQYKVVSNGFSSFEEPGVIVIQPPEDVGYFVVSALFNQKKCAKKITTTSSFIIEGDTPGIQTKKDTIQ